MGCISSKWVILSHELLLRLLRVLLSGCVLLGDAPDAGGGYNNAG